MTPTGTSHGAHPAPARAAATHAGTAAGAAARQSPAGQGGHDATAPGDAFSALLQSLGVGDGLAPDGGPAAATPDAPPAAQLTGTEGQPPQPACPPEALRPTVQLAPPPGPVSEQIASGWRGLSMQTGPAGGRPDGTLEALSVRAGPVPMLPAAGGPPLAASIKPQAQAQPAATATAHARQAAGQDSLSAADGPASALPVRPSVSGSADPLSLPGEGARARLASREGADSTSAGLTALTPAVLPQAQVAPPTAMPAADRLHQGSVASHPMEPGFAGDLAGHVRLMAGEGLQHAELRLHPVDLGPVHIRLVLDGPTADIQFAAVHATTREGLEQALPQLRAQLADAGLQLGQAGVGTGLGGGQGQPAPPWPQPEGNPGQARPGRWRELAMPGQSAEPGGGGAVRAAASTRARGLLDLYA